MVFGSLRSTYYFHTKTHFSLHKLKNTVQYTIYILTQRQEPYGLRLESSLCWRKKKRKFNQAQSLVKNSETYTSVQKLDEF